LRVLDLSDVGFDDPSFPGVWDAFEAGITDHQSPGTSIIGLPRWLLAHPPVGDWVQSQSTVVEMATRYLPDFAFRARPFDDLPQDTMSRDAVVAILHANSNGLRPAVREGLAALAQQRLKHPEAKLVALAEHLFHRGYLEEALRLELFARTAHRKGSYLTLSADVRSVRTETPDRTINDSGGDQALYGFLVSAHEAPAVAQRVVLSGGAGAGKTTTLLQAEAHWALPHPTCTGPSWFPVFTRLDPLVTELSTIIRQDFASTSYTPSVDRFRRTTLIAHARIGRSLTLELLSFMVASPIAYLVDGVTEKTASHAAAWFREINSLQRLNCVVVTARPGEASEPLLELTPLGFSHQIAEVSLRHLDSVQLRDLCAHHKVDASYSDALTGPELATTHGLRNPYLATRLLTVAKSGPYVRTYTAYEIINAYVRHIASSSSDLLSASYEVLPRVAYRAKLFDVISMPALLHDRARRSGLLDASSIPESPQFAHRLLEDFFASISVAEQIDAGREPAEILPGHNRVWPARWEHVLRMALPQLGVRARSELIDHVASRDLRLANRCALELGPEDRGLPETRISARLAGRIQIRASSGGNMDESLADALALGYLDPRLNHADAAPALVTVPESPAAGRRLIGQYPVTNFDFAQFVRSRGYEQEELWKDPAAWQWRTHVRHPAYWSHELLGRPNAPVVGVNYFEAQAYCEWLTRESERWDDPLSFFLPASRDWDRAAGLLDTELLSIIEGVLAEPSRHGWDLDSPEAERALEPVLAKLAASAERFSSLFSFMRRNGTDAVPRPIGIFSPSASGCFDMVGHVWEWCVWTGSADSCGMRYPVVKGGPSWREDALLPAVIGGVFDPFTRFHQVGFRVAAVPRKER
jgi:formylglycine-generating enzyme required for sulfatase activity